jgi:hypothetical protein
LPRPVTRHPPFAARSREGHLIIETLYTGGSGNTGGGFDRMFVSGADSASLATKGIANLTIGSLDWKSYLLVNTPTGVNDDAREMRMAG